jgi:hypothetical protein
LLWCLRRRASDVRCVLVGPGLPVEIQVVQDRDIILTELFPDESLAVHWAKVYSERLRGLGWHDSPP